jgi:flagellar biosynthetic protein FliR
VKKARFARSDVDLTPYTIWTPTLILATARVGGVFLIAPVLSHPAVPGRLRFAVSVAIALAAVGAMGRFAAPAALPATWAGLALAAAGELAIGAVIGFAAQMVFVGVELGALHVGQQMGLGLAELYAPVGGDQGGVVRRLFVLTAIVVFLAVGGHRELLAGVLRTFETVPLASFAPGEGALQTVVALLAASFALALRVAAPVLLAVLLATAAMGLLQKTAPQFNLLSTGLGIRAIVGLVAVAAALAALPAVIQFAWSHAARLIAAGGLAAK